MIQYSKKRIKYKVNIDKPQKIEYVKYFENINLDLKGSQKNLKRCQKCLRSKFYQLYEGKLYICPLIPYVKYFNKKFNQKIEVLPQDYISLDDIHNMNDIKKYEQSEKPFCRYCRNAISMKWECSSVHSIDEWTSDKI